MYYTDESAEHMIACDLCKSDIQLADPDGNDRLPDGVITLGAPAGGTYHICVKCRYFGAVPSDTITRIKTIKEQLARTHMTANKIQTFKDAPQWAKRISYKVRMDLDECIEKLKRVLADLEGVGA